MAVCQTCGNDYLMAFEVRTVSDDVYVFDSFECAIQSLAPICENCQVRIVGHGMEVDGRFFCSAHCSRNAEGVQGEMARDTVGVPHL
ncbi:Prokaryotic metallothionein [Micromonosporaceae bacterium DT55]|uniref:Prokaryotic metallothionein n=1 Tax=Melissospora conviva TaxID=3388432 RepID=UPI003C27FECF